MTNVENGTVPCGYPHGTVFLLYKLTLARTGAQRVAKRLFVPDIMDIRTVSDV